MNSRVPPFLSHYKMPIQPFVRASSHLEPEQVVNMPVPPMAIIVPPKPGELAPPTVQNVPKYARPDAILVEKTGTLEEMQEQLDADHHNKVSAETMPGTSQEPLPPNSSESLDLQIKDGDAENYSVVPPPPQLQSETTGISPKAGLGYDTERHEELLHKNVPGTAGKAISAFFSELPSSVLGAPKTDENGFIPPDQLPPRGRVTGFGFQDPEAEPNKLGRHMTAYFSKQRDDSTDLIPRLGRLGLGVANSAMYGGTNALVNSGIRFGMDALSKAFKPTSNVREDVPPPISRRSLTADHAARGSLRF